MKDYIKEVLARTPKLEQALEEAKAKRTRIDAGLEPEPSEIVRYQRTTSNDPGYFICPMAQLTKYANIPSPKEKDKSNS